MCLQNNFILSNLFVRYEHYALLVRECALGVGEVVGGGGGGGRGVWSVRRLLQSRVSSLLGGWGGRVGGRGEGVGSVVTYTVCWRKHLQSQAVLAVGSI